MCACASMFLQMFVCFYTFITVFICKCHNKSLETCLGLLRSHVHHCLTNGNVSSLGDRPQTASLVYQMEILCSKSFLTISCTLGEGGWWAYTPQQLWDLCKTKIMFSFVRVAIVLKQNVIRAALLLLKCIILANYLVVKKYILDTCCFFVFKWKHHFVTRQ